MTEVLHFGILVEINRVLRENKTGYSLHAIGGCANCGVELRVQEPTVSVNEVVSLINNYLHDQWIHVQQSEENEYLLNVKSNFR